MIVRMMRMRVVGGGDCECSCGSWFQFLFLLEVSRCLFPCDFLGRRLCRAAFVSVD